MAIMEVLFRGRYAGQEVINRWNYVASGTPAAVSLSFALATAFGMIEDGGALPTGTPMRVIQQYTNGGLVFIESQVRDVYSLTDFYANPFNSGTNGDLTGEGLSPVMAWGFRSNRIRTDVRRGTKRIAGLNEDYVGDAGVLTETALTNGALIAGAMSNTLSYDDEGNTLTFTPAVCGKELYHPSTGRDAYRYYATAAEQLSHTASGVTWQLYDTARSQTSRQYGRGA